VIASMVVVLDEAGYLASKPVKQIIVFKDDAVLHGLVPTLDLALGLGCMWHPRHGSFVGPCYSPPALRCVAGALSLIILCDPVPPVCRP
jgi:hypothetical protein